MLQMTSVNCLSKFKLSIKQQASAELIFKELDRLKGLKHMLQDPTEVCQDSIGNLFIKWDSVEMAGSGRPVKRGRFAVDEEGFIEYLIIGYKNDFSACDVINTDDLFTTLLYLSSELT
jgi:hypothetical protein